jgi:hypothetical protein
MMLNQRHSVLTLAILAGLAGCAADRTARACPPEDGSTPSPQVEREVTVLRMAPGARVNQTLTLTLDGQNGDLIAMRPLSDHLVVTGVHQPHARATVLAVGDDGPQRTLRVKENGRDIRVEQRGEKVTATINGKEVPADAVTVKNGTVEVRDADGKTVLKEEWPEMNVISHPFNTFTVPAVPPIAPVPPLPPGVTWPGVDEVETPRVMMGITMENAEDGVVEQLGLPKGEYPVIQTVPEGLPAAKAGLQPKDLIVSIDGKSAEGTDGVRDVLKSKKAGDTINVEVVRKGNHIKLDVKLEAFDGKRFKVWNQVMGGQGQNDKVWQQFDQHMKSLKEKSGKELDKNVKDLDIEQLKDNLRWAIPRGKNGEPMILMNPGEGSAKLEERLDAMEAQLKRLEELLKRLESRTATPAPTGGGGGTPTPFFAMGL